MESTRPGSKPISSKIEWNRIKYILNNFNKKNFLSLDTRKSHIMEKGINLGELIFKLKITKQSLNRVLRDLIKSKMIKQIQDDHDTRKKNLFLEKEGKIFFEAVYSTQKKRIFNALKSSSSDSVIKFKEVLKKIIDGK